MKPATPILFLCAAAAFGQVPPKQDAVVTLANTPTAQTVKQMTTILRTVADVPEVSFDEAHSSFTLRGQANQLGLAEWLLRAMDKPAGWQSSTQEAADPSSREYHSQKGGYPIEDRSPVARIYYLTNTTSKLGMQEILTVARAVGEIQQMAECDSPRLIVFRGTATIVDLGEWITRKLDVPAGGGAFALQNQNPGANLLKLPGTSDGTEDIVRVLYLDPAMSQKGIGDLSRKIRATLAIRTIFWKTSPPAIVVRGSSALLAQAQQIVNSQ